MKPVELGRQDLFSHFADAPTHGRLAAARYIAGMATVADLPDLKAALAKETVSFIRRSLRQTIDRVEGQAPAISEMEGAKEELPLSENALMTQAVNRSTGIILHEIVPHVGSIEFEASKAVDDYPNSRLKLKIDLLNDFLKGIEELRDATRSSSISEFPLRDHLNRCVNALMVPSVARVLIDGRDDLEVVADPNLLSIAFCNGLRNAIEATTDISEGPVIVITMGETDVDYWVTIIDNGLGIAGSSEAAFQVGRSTKDGHRGMGLSIARQSMATMDGSVDLKANAHSGTIFELRWFK